MTKARLCKRCHKIVAGECDCAPPPRRSTCRDGYGRRWQRFRMRVMRRRIAAGTFSCGMCGRVFGAESPHADHIVPVMNEDDPLFYAEHNIQFLHPACHGEKTAGDVRGGRTR